MASKSRYIAEDILYKPVLKKYKENKNDKLKEISAVELRDLIKKKMKKET